MYEHRAWNPKDNITVYELAQAIPLLQGLESDRLMLTEVEWKDLDQRGIGRHFKSDRPEIHQLDGYDLLGHIPDMHEEQDLIAIHGA